MTIAEADPRSSEASILIGQFVEEVAQRYGTSPRTDAEALWPSCFDVEGRVFPIAWLDGQPVGCGAIVPVDPITTEFRRVYVIPDYRRQGIAAKLIRWLEERARAGGFRGLSTFPLRGTQRDDLLSRPGLRGGVSRSHVKFICAETPAYRDSHAARARVGEGRVGGSATGRLGWRLF
jgi:GNAT superfamily N-acetyltransferase